ncbi:MAG: D-glycero-beta-D-manno-heptose 1-phosphate adenylyltransferase [Bacteriovoracaceae bacterium]|nr:D-glycero-beta-D-manno-heptose 1-phosphate adenylyltransferase [Bacteriovoracaceae bacterium]
MFNLSDQAKNFLEQSSRKNKRIVFTNGCFDILHTGHLTYLNEAKKQGDLLFIGLNSDSSIKKIKGPNRPINQEKERKFFLENLKAVDFVEIFNEETPLELIKKVNPSVLVKGGDWKVHQIVGHDHVTSYGGEVFSLSFKQGLSTTKFIQGLQGKT